jgi:hypothetical protein
MGESFANQMGDAMNWEGEWAWLSSGPTVPNQVLWIKMTEDYMKAHPDKFARMKNVEVLSRGRRPACPLPEPQGHHRSRRRGGARGGARRSGREQVRQGVGYRVRLAQLDEGLREGGVR